MSVDAIIDATVGREGGYSNRPSDPGGATMFGITERVARRNGYMGDMRALPRATALAIYKAEYWTKPGFGDVATLNEAIAEELFDTGVNCGVGIASGFLQVALNAFNQRGTLYPDVKVDQDIGPGTLAALKAYLAKRGAQGVTVMLRALNCQQGARYIAIGAANPNLEDYEFGWLLNRVSV